MLNYAINTDNSANIIADKLVRKLNVSTTRDRGELHPLQDALRQYTKEQIAKIKVCSTNLLETELSVKNYYAHEDKLRRRALQDYHKALEGLKVLVSDLHSRYRDFIVTNADPNDDNRIRFVNNRGFINMEQILSTELKKLERVPSLEPFGLYENNPLDIKRMMKKAYEENLSGRDFLSMVEKKWGFTTHDAAGSALGIAPKTLTNIYSQRNPSIHYRTAEAISKKLFGSVSEKLISIVCGNQADLNVPKNRLDVSIDPRQFIIDACQKAMVNEEDSSKRHELLKGMLTDICKLSGMLPYRVSEQNGKHGEFILRSAKNPGPETIKEVAAMLPGLDKTHRQQVSYLLNGLYDFRDANELLKDALIDRKTFFNNLFKRSLMTKIDYADHLGVSTRCITDLLDDKKMRVTTYINIRSKLGVAEELSKDYMQLALERSKLTVEEQRAFLFNHLNGSSPSLSEIRKTIGITVEEIITALDVNVVTRQIYEKNNMIPERKMELAFRAYRIPDELKDIFRDKFGQNGRKFRTDLGAITREQRQVESLSI